MRKMPTLSKRLLLWTIHAISIHWALLSDAGLFRALLAMELSGLESAEKSDMMRVKGRRI